MEWPGCAGLGKPGAMAHRLVVFLEEEPGFWADGPRCSMLPWPPAPPLHLSQTQCPYGPRPNPGSQMDFGKEKRSPESSYEARLIPGVTAWLQMPKHVRQKPREQTHCCRAVRNVGVVLAFCAPLGAGDGRGAGQPGSCRLSWKENGHRGKWSPLSSALAFIYKFKKIRPLSGLIFFF